MELAMNNANAIALIDGCRREIERIKGVREAFGSTSPSMELMTKYSVIKCCGTIEQCFKAIVFDKVENNAVPQARSYIEQTFREGSMNPSIDNIHKSLNLFDEEWNARFRAKINAMTDKERIRASLKSLNENRNHFAHGKSITVSFDQVVGYFEDSCLIIEALDDVIG
jgi:hypothetical protein